MELKEAIAAVRKEAGLTQEEMARKLYVTRQAISRWENGETTPGIDMVKLICVTFNVPIDKFLDMPAPNLCQCCGMSLTSELYGTLSNGTSTADYCKWCYEEGAFTSPDMNMDEFIERTAPMTAEAMGVSLDEAVSFMATLLPTLKRWKEVEDNEKKYGKELREKYGDEVIDAANEKYRSRSASEHQNAQDLEEAIKSQLACAIKTGSATSPEAKELATLHASWLQIHWPDGMYSPETHRGLVDGYLMDERFKKYYEAVAPGATQFLRDAVHANI